MLDKNPWCSCVWTHSRSPLSLLCLRSDSGCSLSRTNLVSLYTSDMPGDKLQHLPPASWTPRWSWKVGVIFFFFFFYTIRIGWVSGIILAALSFKECILNDGLSASEKVFSGKKWLCPPWAGSHWSFHKVSLAQVNMAFEIIKGKNQNLSAFIKSNLCLHIRICITQHHAEGWLASRSSWVQRRRTGLLINGPGSKRGQHH